jgi:hypothetical protein
MEKQVDYFAATKRRKEMEEEEDDEERITALLDSYAPLSNLPTPPLSGETSPTVSSSITTPSMSYFTQVDTHDTGMFMLRPSGGSIYANSRTAPAKALSHLVRREAGGNHRPSVERITCFLQRANMTETQVAFAACILSRLSWRFVREWRNALDALQSPLWNHSSRQWLRQRPAPRKPEVIILAALSLASMWLDDFARSHRFWVEDVGKMQHSRRELAMTQRCILQDEGINYRLLTIATEDVEIMWTELYEVSRPSTAARRIENAVKSEGLLAFEILPPDSLRRQR